MVQKKFQNKQKLKHICPCYNILFKVKTWLWKFLIYLWTLNTDMIWLLINLCIKFRCGDMFIWYTFNASRFSRRGFEWISSFLLNTIHTACFCLKYSQTCSNNHLWKTATRLRWSMLSLPKDIPMHLLLYKTTTCLTRPANTFFCLPNENKPV